MPLRHPFGRHGTAARGGVGRPNCEISGTLKYQNRQKPTSWKLFGEQRIHDSFAWRKEQRVLQYFSVFNTHNAKREFQSAQKHEFQSAHRIPSTQKAPSALPTRGFRKVGLRTWTLSFGALSKVTKHCTTICPHAFEQRRTTQMHYPLRL